MSLVKNLTFPLSMQVDFLFFLHQTTDFKVFYLGIAKQIYFFPSVAFVSIILLCGFGTVVCVRNL